jgi:hypothetical protein
MLLGVYTCLYHRVHERDYELGNRMILSIAYVSEGKTPTKPCLL